MCPLLGPPPLGMTARFCIVEDCGGRSSARDSDSPVGLWPPKAVALPDEEPMISYRKYRVRQDNPVFRKLWAEGYT